MCNELIPPNPNSLHTGRNVFRQSRYRAALPVLSTITALCVGLFSSGAIAASFQEQGGLVVMEAENFDANVTQPGGAWVFDATPLTDAYSGWGYLKAVGVGGYNPSVSPHVDFKVNFTTTGPHYIWVKGSDAGSQNVHLGLDGVAPDTAQFVGASSGAFGPELGGEFWWDNQYNPGGAGITYAAYLDVPTTGEHTVNLFFRLQDVYVDKILLTTDSNYEPPGLHNGDVGPETLALSTNLAVAITQPTSGKSFPSNTVVTVVAKPFTNSTSVSKIDFFATPLPSGTETNIGQATALPYQIGWTDPAVGNYALKAVVTDSGSATATSAVVNVAITVPNTCPTPLVWSTNTFDAGLGSFTALKNNHVASDIPPYRIDFDWTNSANAGGPAGELGGIFARIGNAEAYVAEPLSGPVSLNDELWFRSKLLIHDEGLWNTDFFFGYFNTNSVDSRVGFKVINPNNGIWRFRLFAINQGPDKIYFIDDGTVGQWEFHWIPSGLGDGSGMATAMVVSNGVTYAFTNTFTSASSATFNAIGWLIPYQPTSDYQSASAWFDNVEHKVPGYTALKYTHVGDQLILSWGADGYSLQYNDDSIANSSAWVDYGPVTPVGRTYSVTNTIPHSLGSRFFRLKLNCL